MNKISTFANRLTEALHTKGVKAVELAKMTGLSQSLISQYMHGYCEAKQDNLYIICQALQIDYGWMMGLDVPMELETAEHLRLREKIKDMILNAPDETLKKVIQYIEDIT